ncbi:hypothetical protein BKA59DRAFT_555057 [Fusarium tricinctum]|uniref:Uncharacterized protein n=1 Tax=Fusarium tricinctum TaxID=61284 RepID=A0A8K0WF25_9HYPO|nr:hypothetical protein BKA59DRAFT_555057 [Fusarium tricinctum]
MESSKSTSTAQILGVLLPVLSSGIGGGESLIAIPALAELTPAERVRAFRGLYNIGGIRSPTLGVVASSVLAYNSWLSYPASGEQSIWKLYAVAAVSTLAVAPFTVFIMGPTNARLLLFANKVDKGEEISDSDVTAQLGTWKFLNYTRYLLPLGASLLALRAILS